MRRKTARTAALAVVVGLALLAAACSSGTDHDHASPERADRASRQLRSDMRELWEDHVTWTRVVIISAAADLLVAVKSGDTTAQGDASTRWYTNADDIARFLARADPEHWPEPDMAEMMRTHLDLTLEEATARLTGDWAGDVIAYNRVVAESRHMADMLTDGIVAQFPERFS